MYLLLGHHTVINQKEIIGIFDLDGTTVSKKTRDYLSKAEKEKRVVSVSYDLPKSFVVCSDNKKDEFTVYLSPVATSTLYKRTQEKDSF